MIGVVLGTRARRTCSLARPERGWDPRQLSQSQPECSGRVDPAQSERLRIVLADDQTVVPRRPADGARRMPDPSRTASPSAADVTAEVDGGRAGKPIGQDLAQSAGIRGRPQNRSLRSTSAPASASVASRTPARASTSRPRSDISNSSGGSGRDYGDRDRLRGSRTCQRAPAWPADRLAVRAQCRSYRRRAARHVRLLTRRDPLRLRLLA